MLLHTGPLGDFLNIKSAIAPKDKYPVLCLSSRKMDTS